MRQPRTWVALIAGGCIAGCAGAHPPAPESGTGEAMVWGDEYEGLLVDTDLRDADMHAARARFAADALFGNTRVVRAKASAGPVAARWRESDAGRAGALEWTSRGVAVVAGAVRASLGEGAVLADARDAASVEPRGTRALDGLRLFASSSMWGSSVGAGARVALGRVRIAAGAWQEREPGADRRAFVSAGLVGRRTIVHAAAGRSDAGPSVASLCAARGAPGVFVSGELGLASDGARAVARVVAGANGGWRAFVAAGAPSAADDPTPASPGRRWGGAIERRASAGRIATRTVLSSRVRRDGPDVERRQRAECFASTGASGARVEAGVRATRETASQATDLLDPPLAVAVHDEVRLRCAVRTSESVGDKLAVEQMYRVDIIVSGAGRAGRVVAWTGRGRWRRLDARVQAAAFDLAPGQLGYAGRAALPGAATFTTLSQSGIDLSASVRVRIGLGAAAGAQAVRTAAGEARFVVQAGVAW